MKLYRVQFTIGLEREDGMWLLDKIDEIGGSNLKLIQISD